MFIKYCLQPANSTMIFKTIFFLIICFQSQPSKAQNLVRVGYFSYQSEDEELPISDINSSLFTHLICGFAELNSTTYELDISSDDDEKRFSIFTETVKKKNPSVITLLSIGGPGATYSTFSLMVSDSFSRNSFIKSSIEKAKLYGFQGLDLWWVDANSSDDMSNLGILFEEWQDAITLEANNSKGSKLILTAAVNYAPRIRSDNYPVDSIQQHLDWVHVRRCGELFPDVFPNYTAAPLALYNPNAVCSTDSGITTWINAGLSANKIVMFLPYYGVAWTLLNPKENGIGAPAMGEATDVDIEYKQIKNSININRAKVTFDETHVVNYFTMENNTWVAFDDVEAIRRKVSYAKEKRLLGYFVWEVSYDDNWVLSQAAALELEASKVGKNNSTADQKNNRGGQTKQPYRFLVVILPIIAAVILLLGLVIYFRCRRKLKLQGTVESISVQDSRSQENNITSAAGDLSGNVPTLALYSLANIEAATDGFSSKNKLGEGGYGPVYKGVLQDGQEVAVKKLSKTSIQGFEEFKNEVMLTAKLQHVNLVRLLGFCKEMEEHILIYEYMPNKSLDYYLFDPIKKYMLDWEKRVHIIEGICQGLLYLQEYSRLTIIHRDLKASNVLLDQDMKPKISDFGMARIFTKGGHEANTGRIVGTYGYVPPEYVKRGIYSTKSDVYSFGVLLLQIISGKKVSNLYGENGHLSLLEYAYELWKDGKGIKLMDPSLDDMHSPCRLIRCLHIGLLCVQEIPIDRPSILEISWMLRNEATNLMIPKKPALSNQADAVVQSESSTSNLEMCSNNDTTFSNLEAR